MCQHCKWKLRSEWFMSESRGIFEKLFIHKNPVSNFIFTRSIVAQVPHAFERIQSICRSIHFCHVHWTNEELYKHWLTSHRKAFPLRFVWWDFCKDWKSPRIEVSAMVLRRFYWSEVLSPLIPAPPSSYHLCAMQIISWYC